MNKQNRRPVSSGLCRTSNGFKSLEKDAAYKSSVSINAHKDYHDHYMRYLIATNADYFQSKMRVIPRGKAKDVRFKIPCRTGMTIYKKDYNEKQAKYNKEGGARGNMTADCIKTNNFLGDEPIDLRISDKTNYQKDYKYCPMKTEHCRRFKKRGGGQAGVDDAPRFLETQNKIDFLNWAGKNSVTSMKPADRSAATNLPFSSMTAYKSDFEAKSVTPTPVLLRGSSYPNFSSISMMMKSNYACEFDEKKSVGEASCKPKHYNANLCKKFKGCTEYKSSFIGFKKEDTIESEAYTNLEDLQTLIIDL